MIDCADFEKRIADAIANVKLRRGAFPIWNVRADARRQAAQIADRLPGLFRTDEIEL
jgi:hypothetical protein